MVRRLIASGHGLPYTAIAQAPTVTLPRLKALTTGSNPTFLDAMLNLSEDDAIPQLGEVDSWVRQLKMTGKKMAFTGDDTWLRLFPEDWWSWKEGVSSFFVAVRNKPPTPCLSLFRLTLVFLPPGFFEHEGYSFGGHECYTPSRGTSSADPVPGKVKIDVDNPSKRLGRFDFTLPRLRPCWSFRGTR